MAFGDTGTSGIALHISGVGPEASASEGLVFHTLDGFRQECFVGSTTSSVFPEDSRFDIACHCNCPSKIVE